MAVEEDGESPFLVIFPIIILLYTAIAARFPVCHHIPGSS
jgi:hypothetical protein